MSTLRFASITGLVALIASAASCAPEQQPSSEPDGESLGQSSDELCVDAPAPGGATSANTPVGLALEIDQGAGVPLKVRAGQRFYVNQIDIRASVQATIDEEVDGLDRSGDFAQLDWDGIQFEDESFVGQQNADGTYTRRRFFRGADWMDKPSQFRIDQIDAKGKKIGATVVVGTGLEYHRTPADSFFVRRLRAIQWAYDCESATSCDEASVFEEEALVELRYAGGSRPTFQVSPQTKALRVTWTLRPTKPYTIPLEQVAAPAWDYGFDMELSPITPPAPDGTYAPGQSVSFQFTLKDGAGKPLHAPGVLPSYADFLSGSVESGIQYWRGFSEPYATYYRRKHREKQLLLAVMGPAQDLGPIYNVVDIAERLDFATGVVTSATVGGDGFYAAAAGVPSFAVLFGGPAFWALPTTDTWTFDIPADAAPGTYYAILKGRRSYLGEDVPKSKVISIQVGSPAPTSKVQPTGKCGSCHSGAGSFDRVLHGTADRTACTACHAPLSFELEGPVYVRSHFIHSRSNRFGANLERCANCHIGSAGIQRTSKSACLSCHQSYPDDHVTAFGPITDMYIGGGAESFQQCSTTCHTSHPGSGL